MYVYVCMYLCNACVAACVIFRVLRVFISMSLSFELNKFFCTELSCFVRTYYSGSGARKSAGGVGGAAPPRHCM